MTDTSRKTADETMPQQYNLASRPIATSVPSTDSLNLSHIDPQLLPGVSANDSFLGVPMGSDLKPSGEEFSWEMIGLGLEEPLPLQETINDL